jgi:23S rRNA G2445 N2-methylase RlmL
MVETVSEGFKSLDLKRTEQVLQAQTKTSKHRQGKVLLNVVKDQGEVLISTSYEDLHKHGYKPFMRWGVLKETLTAACILESGILERARRTGKLHVWDPFCGSGSFLIEMLMMMMEQPCRSLTEAMPF